MKTSPNLNNMNKRNIIVNIQNSNNLLNYKVNKNENVVMHISYKTTINNCNNSSKNNQDIR